MSLRRSTMPFNNPAAHSQWSVMTRRLWYLTTNLGLASWFRGIVRSEMLPHNILLVTLYEARQPQPPFCHVQENELVVKVSDCLSQLGAGFSLRSVRATFVHEKVPSPSNLRCARHLNAAPNRLFPIS